MDNICWTKRKNKFQSKQTESESLVIGELKSVQHQDNTENANWNALRAING